MALFGLFGGNKRKEDEEAANLELKLEASKKLVEQQRKEHENLPWPHPVPLSHIKVSGGEPETMEDPVSSDRKDEIGPLVFEEKISPEVLKEMTLQELLFVLTTQEVFNAKAKLANFSDNHRIIYNELLNRIRDAKTYYAIYDARTNYPFIEGGFAYIYLDEELANKAVEAYNRQYRKLVVKNCPARPDGASDTDRGFFDYLYYLGIERIIIDNGQYRARFLRSEIVAAPWQDNEKRPPINPSLRLAMLDFLSEVRWPVKYEKRPAIVHAKEMRMISLVLNGMYIVPLTHEGPVEMSEDGKVRFNKDTRLRFPILKTKDDKVYLPVFTDGIEFGKKFGREGFEGAVFAFRDILRFVEDKDGITINPMGENIMLPKEKMLELQAAAESAMSANANQGSVAGNVSDQDMIKRASAEEVADTIAKVVQKNAQLAKDVKESTSDEDYKEDVSEADVNTI
ncbi:SseB family protein [Butyrivibrio sp. NC3005]|uniref:SseB family protein n=1 Tax=Butyrivibrio sp. NC3005 TaxID=1280685 RepID=UPI000420C933|nr:SseB family protein [Butyrivibrio sp. NC3005]